MSLVTFLGIYFVRKAGIDIATVGVAFLCEHGLRGILAPMFGALSDRIGRRTLLIAAGVLLARGAFRAMGLAGTSANPYGSATVLVTQGPFRWTRNPLYLAQTLLYIGMAMALNTVWPMVWLPAVLLVMRYGVIEREERYLDTRFGAAYRAYRSTVRRWV